MSFAKNLKKITEEAKIDLPSSLLTDEEVTAFILKCTKSATCAANKGNSSCAVLLNTFERLDIKNMDENPINAADKRILDKLDSLGLDATYSCAIRVDEDGQDYGYLLGWS